MTIQINNELRDRAYQCACNHGFHDKDYSDEHLLMLIITEISEAVQAHRNKKYADVSNFVRATTTTAYKQTDERYYDISCKRIKDAINEKKQSLFK